MGKPSIGGIEAAIISRIKDAGSIEYIPDNQVQTLSRRSFDFSSEQLIVIPPAVIVVYLGGKYQKKEVTGHGYQIAERFMLLAIAENLRGPEQGQEGFRIGATFERGAYKILEDLKSLFAGEFLTIDTDSRVHCTLVGTSFEGINPAGHYVYGLEVNAGATSWDNV